MPDNSKNEPWSERVDAVRGSMTRGELQLIPVTHVLNPSGAPKNLSPGDNEIVRQMEASQSWWWDSFTEDSPHFFIKVTNHGEEYLKLLELNLRPECDTLEPKFQRLRITLDTSLQSGEGAVLTFPIEPSFIEGYKCADIAGVYFESR